MLDSGSTGHMTGSSSIVRDLNPNDDKITVTYANKSKSKVMGFVKVVVAHDITLVNVMLVETLGYNLLSVRALGKMGFAVFLDDDIVVLIGESLSRSLSLGTSNMIFMWWTFQSKPLQVRCAYSGRLTWVGYGIAD